MKYLPNVTMAWQWSREQSVIFMQGLAILDARDPGLERYKQLSERRRPFDATSPGSCPAATSTCTRRLAASKCWKDRRARCSVPAHKLGVLRYITNKPKLDVTEGDVQRRLSAYTSGGDPSSNVDAMISTCR